MFRILSLAKSVPAARAVTQGPSQAFARSARPFSSLMRPMGRPQVAMPSRMGLSAPSDIVGVPSSPTLDLLGQQVRFKSRGNTYQPSMLKRKRRCGFLTRLRSRGGRKILARRRAKGRWYLTY